MEKSKNQSLKRISLVLALIIIAFLGGILGELFTRTYLSQLDFFRDFYFTGADTLGQRDLIISQPKKVVVEQDLRLNQLAGEIRPSVLGIYNKKKEGKNFSDNLYLASDLSGQAFVLTSDGWLISSAAALPGTKDNYAVYYNYKVYDIEKVIKDEMTGAAFIKINAQNLPVIKLADIQNVFNGQQTFIYNSYYQQIHLANIIDDSYRTVREKNDLIVFSQDLDKRIIVDNDFGADLIGSPVFTLEGEIAGIYEKSGTGTSSIIPINFVSSIINQVLKDEKLTRPYLGIYYIDLSKAVSLNDNQGQIAVSKGAYVQSVAADSPIFDIIVKGDIIISLENQELDSNNDLVDLLMAYKAGQEVRLKFRHLDKDQEISVILK